MAVEPTIRRGVRNGRYAVIPNHVFEDHRLSMEARWLLGYLLSKPDNWNILVGDITKKGNCGRDKVRKMIGELVDLGYAEREQQRDEGKFRANSYVIYDEPSLGIHSDIQADGESVAFLPQTEMPSTASPSPVPPSTAKTSLSNNLDLVNPENQNLREGVREDFEEQTTDGDEQSQASIERAFKRWFFKWPTGVDDSEPEARRAWNRLTAEERAAAEKLTPVYLAARLKIGRTEKGTCAAGKYLREKRWERLTTASSVVLQPPVLQKAFSRGWQGLRLSVLLGPEAPLPRLTSFLQGVVLNRETPEAIERGDSILREHRARYAWPKVTDMHNGYRPVSVPDHIASAAEGFKPYHVNSAEVAGWKRLHEQRGWPWPAMGSAEWICFPVCDGGDDASIDAALDEFRDAISEGQGDEHAA